MFPTDAKPTIPTAPALSNRPPRIKPPRLTVVEAPTTQITDSPSCTKNGAKQMK